MKIHEYRNRRRLASAPGLLAVSLLVVLAGVATSAFSQVVTCTARAITIPQVPLMTSVPMGTIDLACMDSVSGSGGALTLQVTLSTVTGLSAPSATLTGGSGSMTVAGSKAAPNAYVFTFTNVVRPIRMISVSNLSANTQQLPPAAPIRAGLSLTGTLGNISPSNSPIIVGIVQPLCIFTVSPTSILVPAGGGSDRVQVSCTTGCIGQTWTPSSDQSWLVVSGSGAGSGFFTWSAAANTSSNPRTGVIKVAAQTITASQNGAPSPGAISCTASASSTPPVPAVSSTAVGDIHAFCTDSGSGTGGTLTLKVALSTNYGLMTPTATVSGGNGSLTVAGTRASLNVFNFTISNLVRPLRSISVTNLTADTQKLGLEAGTVLATLNLAASFGNIQVINPQMTVARLCAFTFSPSAIEVPPAGGTGVITVKGSPGCGSLEASSSESWLKVVGEGSPSGTISWKAEANTLANRSATIKVRGAAPINVFQPGTVAKPRLPLQDPRPF